MTDYTYNYDPQLVASEAERYFHIPDGSVAEKNRTRRVARARRITFKILRDSGWSYGDIGHVYERHYSTVVQVIRNWKEGDDEAFIIINRRCEARQKIEDFNEMHGPVAVTNAST